MWATRRVVQALWANQRPKRWFVHKASLSTAFRSFSREHLTDACRSLSKEVSIAIVSGKELALIADS